MFFSSRSKADNRSYNLTAYFFFSKKIRLSQNIKILTCGLSCCFCDNGALFVDRFKLFEIFLLNWFPLFEDKFFDDGDNEDGDKYDECGDDKLLTLDDDEPSSSAFFKELD